MKKIILCLLVFVNSQIFCQEIYRLDNAIQFVGKQLESEIRQGSSIAIVNFDSSSEKFSNYVIGELNNLFTNNKKLTVAEQQKIDLVRREEKYQLSGSVSDETMVRIGHNIGAQYIISGFLIDLGTTYRFGIYAINMEKATRAFSSSVYLSGYDEQVVFLVTGKIGRPSEKVIPTNVTKYSSKAAFMQSASIFMGNSLINRIPRNSIIAIAMPENFVLVDYVKNEIMFILNNSKRFKLIEQNDVNSAISKIDIKSYYPPNGGVVKIDYYQQIGKMVGANVVIFCDAMERDGVDGYVDECLIRIRATYVNSAEQISESRAYWAWPDLEYFE
jgi:hypothetical protein